MTDKQIRHQQIGYMRVSSVDQNTLRQLDNMELDEVFTDKCSGNTIERPELKRLIKYARAVDTVHVHSIDRMARNVGDLIEIVKTLNAKGVSVKFYQEQLLFAADNSNPMSELMLNLLGSVYQFERSMLLERQKQGIAKAKAAGKYKGRPKSIDPVPIIEYLSKGISISKTAKLADCGPATVQRIKRENYEQIARAKLLHQQKEINKAVAAIAV